MRERPGVGHAIQIGEKQMTDKGIQIETLKHASVMIGNAFLREKSRYRRDGGRLARRIINDLILNLQESK